MMPFSGGELWEDKSTGHTSLDQLMNYHCREHANELRASVLHSQRERPFVILKRSDRPTSSLSLVIIARAYYGSPVHNRSLEASCSFGFRKIVDTLLPLGGVVLKIHNEIACYRSFN